MNNPIRWYTVETAIIYANPQEHRHTIQAYTADDAISQMLFKGCSMNYDKDGRGERITGVRPATKEEIQNEKTKK
jgi:hypothetical protein